VKVIFDTNKLYANSLIKDRLPIHLAEFLVICMERGHEIILPLTTLLEFNNKQLEFANKERKKLEDTKKNLSIYQIKFEDFDSKELVKPPDLVQLINKIGVTCEVVEPLKEDFDIAHKKACLKISPLPPEKKSNEMRDLVIWEISLRVAKEHKGAILMSEDVVHTHHRGDIEADKNGLIRCKSFERALEAFTIETESAKKIKSILDKVWDRILESDLPIRKGGKIVSILRPIFQNTNFGVVVVNCDISFITGDGKTLLSKLLLNYYNEEAIEIKFYENIIEGESLDDTSIKIKDQFVFNLDLDDRESSLRELLK